MRVYAVVNLKGGTGKTTTAINVARGLRKAGKDVLLVDLDPQGNSTDGCIGNFNGNTVNQVINETIKLKDCVVETPLRFDLLPADISLSAIELKNKEWLYKGILETDYDYVVIDCGPTIGNLFVSAVLACRANGSMIVPIKLGRDSLVAANNVRKTLSVIAKKAGLDINYKLLFTMMNRNRLEEETARQVRKMFPNQVYKTQIRYQALPIAVYAYKRLAVIDSKNQTFKVAQDYRDFIQELLNEEKESKK